MDFLFQNAGIKVKEWAKNIVRINIFFVALEAIGIAIIAYALAESFVVAFMAFLISAVVGLFPVATTYAFALLLYCLGELVDNSKKHIEVSKNILTSLEQSKNSKTDSEISKNGFGEDRQPYYVNPIDKVADDVHLTAEATGLINDLQMQIESINKIYDKKISAINASDNNAEISSLKKEITSLEVKRDSLSILQTNQKKELQITINALSKRLAEKEAAKQPLSVIQKQVSNLNNERQEKLKPLEEQIKAIYESAK